MLMIGEERMATIAMTIIVIDTIQICVPIVVKFYCFYLFVTLFIKRGFPFRCHKFTAPVKTVSSFSTSKLAIVKKIYTKLSNYLTLLTKTPFFRTHHHTTAAYPSVTQYPGKVGTGRLLQTAGPQIDETICLSFISRDLSPFC